MATPRPPVQGPDPHSDRAQPRLPSADASLDLAREGWWSLAQHIPAYLSVLDEGFRIVAVNRLATPGAVPGDIIGRDAFEFLAEADRAVVRAAYARVLASGEPGLVTFQLRRLDGQPGWARASVARVALGDRPALLVSMMDVTELKTAEAALRASEAKWRSLVESTPERITIVDPAFRFVYVNHVSADIRPEAVIGRRVPELMAAEDWPALERAYAQVREHGRTVTMEVQGGPPGQEKWWRTTIGPLRDSEGAFVGYMSVASDITDRKRSEQELKASEARWRSLVESTSDHIMIVDAQRRILFINRSIVGPVTDVVGKRIDEFLRPEDLPGLHAAFEAASQQRPASYEALARSDGGEPHWYRVQVAAIAGGTEFVAVATDIHDARRAHEDLRESEARWRSLVENAPDHVLIVGKDLRLQFVNRLPAHLTLDEVRGMPVLDAVPEEHRDTLREQYRRVFEERASVGYEVPGLGPDGTGRAWWRARMAPIVRDGEVSAAVVISTDVTLRKAQEDLLREREGLLADAERVANMGSFSYEFDTKRTQWSAGMHRVFGTDPATFPGTFEAFLSRVHPDDRERVRAGALSDAPGTREYRIVRDDGEVRHVQSRSNVLSQEGRARRVGVVQDVTELRQAEEARTASEARNREVARLKELDAFKTQFINMAAHELGTPLTPIRLQLDLLQVRSQNLDERQRRSLAIVSRNVDRLSQLVQDVLEVARLQAGRLVLDTKPLDLHPVLADAVESFQEPARQGGLTLELLAPRDLAVRGDARRLTQVVYNLLSNALKFTPRGGRVMVTAERAGPMLRVTVRDTGRGIRAADLGKLFEPFSQVHDPGEGAPPGTGLGLFISRGIVELHGGRISAGSDGLGEGAVFEFTLPAG